MLKPRLRLLDTLRKCPGMTGTRTGCDRAQCGCSPPGQILSATGLLMEGHVPGHTAIGEQIWGNICRCGAHFNDSPPSQCAK
jgi:aerobic-type carbon monoxide dehydrogenase small subunit (CoxS/CutS family)